VADTNVYVNVNVSAEWDLQMDAIYIVVRYRMDDAIS
jgi:hypothetical protein